MCGPGNHPLPAQSPSPSPERGFGPFCALHFHAFVMYASEHNIRFVSARARWPSAER